MSKKSFLAITASLAPLSYSGCGNDQTSLENVRARAASSSSKSTDPGSLGIQSWYTSVNNFDGNVGILDALMPDGSRSLCSGVFVSVTTTAPPELWFVSAKHCLIPHDPLGRPSAVSLSSVPLSVHASAMRGNFPVAANKRFFRNDLVKINVTGFSAVTGVNAVGLPVCVNSVPEQTTVTIVGSGRFFGGKSIAAVGTYVTTPPSNAGPNFSKAFAQGLSFVLPSAGNSILYGDPGDSGGPVIHTLGYKSYCVAGIMSRQYPLRHTGFGLTGITPLDVNFTNPTSWTAP